MVFSSAAALAVLVFAQLCPAKWKPRTRFGGPFDHFLAYFVVTSIVCFAWPRPLVVGVALMVVSALLEWLQRFTPDRKPDIWAASCGAGGALAATALQLVLAFRTSLPIATLPTDFRL